jgi:hypothetical protein
MDWTADGEGTREQLMRIVALLLALGALAERACRAPLSVRVSVMGFLLPAESVARVFVSGEGALPEPGGESDDPAAAMGLAVRFRALAMALTAFAYRFSGRSRVSIGILPVAVDAAGNFTGRSRGKPRPLDTS